jgi:hypothetical protein
MMFPHVVVGGKRVESLERGLPESSFVIGISLTNAPSKPFAAVPSFEPQNSSSKKQKVANPTCLLLDVLL